MKKFVAENTCSSADHDVLMDFHVTHRTVLIGGAAFKAAFAKAKERQLVEAGAAVAQTASEKNNIEADVTTAESRIGNRIANVVEERWRQTLIGVEQQDPVMPEGEVIEGPLALFRPSSAIVKLNDIGSK